MMTRKGEMGMRFIVFDVETPNSANDRMSAIGAAVVEDGVVQDKYYSLVNPQCRFDSFNISLTHITPYMVSHAPTFPQVWEKLGPWFESGLLCAHNAQFDVGVLRSCLHAYQLSWKPSVRYVCTCQMSRSLFPDLPNHRLDTLASFFKLDLDHHNAMSDALACAGILKVCLERGVKIDRFIRTGSLFF